MKKSTLGLVMALMLGSVGTAHAELTEFDAKRLIDNGCSELVRKADFTISPKCKSRIVNMVTHQSTDGPALDITVHSDGYLYDIVFIARYKLDPKGDHKLMDVYRLQ
ncbi:MAG: hypothetical protein HQL36_05775 [Alphaproteobacteria bacterium]|nr:hypothetical protein [Alphaproteobacteria bacterium]MBF0250278.1 hypothetical protein [Alphaproteobacteria bacterium]